MSVLPLFVLCAALDNSLENLSPGESTNVPAQPPPRTVWLGEIGAGFSKDLWAFEAKLSRAFGTTDTGSNQAHNLALMDLAAGFMLTDVMAPEYWFGGNLEARCQLLAGGQDRPEAAYFLGLNGGLRYHFRTGTRLDPFVAGSFGVGLTDIEHPDLSGKFQFNEQIGAGARYFLRPDQAVTLEYALWHVSNGGIREPNDGVNAHVISLGYAWLY